MFKSLIVAVSLFATAAHAEIVGSVDTAWQLFGNHQIVIERFDDPDVVNASCYVSYAKTGGLKGTLGLAEDPNRFSIACRATGPVALNKPVPDTMVEVFNRSTSILFKEMRVSRMLDTHRNVLVYLVWSTQLVDGSPFNSVTAIPID